MPDQTDRVCRLLMGGTLT